MEKEFSFDKKKMRRDLIVLLVVGLVLLATGIFDTTLLFVYAVIILIIFMKSYSERMVRIEGDSIVMYYSRKKEVVKIPEITLIEIEPRKATYKTMTSIKNMHIVSTSKVVEFNVVNIYNEELNQALIELSEQNDFQYVNEHIDMKSN